MDKLSIPFSELSFSYSRSGGAGGQNVNKVNSKVTLEWDLNTTGCPPQVLDRFRQKFANMISGDGVFQLQCDSSRSQKANQDECVRRVNEMLNSVARPPKVRRATKPTRSSIKKRLEGKKKDSEKKRLRKVDF
jgi:ribosome-associated protein